MVLPTVPGIRIPDGGLRGEPKEPGPFAILDVPDGSYRIVFRLETDAGARWAVREFSKSGAPVDLGSVAVDGWASLRVRVLDAEGRPRVGAWLNLSFRGHPFATNSRGEGEVTVADADGDPIVIAEGEPVPEWHHVDGAQSDETGWAVFPSLAPGSLYRVTMGDVRHFEREVTTGPTGSEEVREFRWEGRMVRFRLRFTVGGQVPKRWGPILGGTLDGGGFRDGVLEGECAPGRQSVIVLASLDGGRAMESHGAVLDVPDQPDYEVTIDLK